MGWGWVSQGRPGKERPRQIKTRQTGAESGDRVLAEELNISNPEAASQGCKMNASM